MENLSLKVQKINSKGITLVALVISIIILLILATVSISLLINGGILDKAKSAVDKYSDGEIKERIMLAVTNARMKNMSLLDRTVLDNELKSEFGEENYELLSVGEGVLISVNNVEYLVDKDGKVNDGNKIEESNIEYAGDLSKNGQYDGTTEETAYKISCIEDLVEWSNNANNYSSKNIKLENTIDFNSTASYKNPRAKTTDINGNGTIEELITELTIGKGFKPIESFTGTFDGCENEINNIYIKNSDNAGLFNYMQGTIKNLKITGEIISQQGYAGGFCGKVWGGTASYINLHNAATVKSITSCAGGIIGDSEYNSVNISNCYNSGNISSDAKSGWLCGYAGGIIGYHGYGFQAGKADIRNCCSTGNLSGLGIGGIIGSKLYGSYTMENCYYLSDTASAATTHYGGTRIIGNNFSRADIENNNLFNNLNEYIVNEIEDENLQTENWCKWGKDSNNTIMLEYGKTWDRVNNKWTE